MIPRTLSKAGDKIFLAITNLTNTPKLLKKDHLIGKATQIDCVFENTEIFDLDFSDPDLNSKLQFLNCRNIDIAQYPLQQDRALNSFASNNRRFIQIYDVNAKYSKGINDLVKDSFTEALDNEKSCFASEPEIIGHTYIRDQNLLSDKETYCYFNEKSFSNFTDDDIKTECYYNETSCSRFISLLPQTRDGPHYNEKSFSVESLRLEQDNTKPRTAYMNSINALIDSETVYVWNVETQQVYPSAFKIPKNIEDLKDLLPPHIQDLFMRSCTEIDFDQAKKVAYFLLEFESVFAKDDSELGCYTGTTDSINTGDAKPVRLQMRRTPLGFQSEEERHLKQMLDMGVIRESNSEWAAAPVFSSETRRFREILYRL